MYAEAAGKLRALGVGEGAVGPPAVGVDPAARVADRHPGLAVVDLARHGGRCEGVVGHQELGDAPVEVGRIGLARAADHQPGLVAQDAEFGPGIVAYPAHAIVRLRLIAERRRGAVDGERFLLILGQHGMQEREVGGIDIAPGSATSCSLAT
jgi:hypothetical protein